VGRLIERMISSFHRLVLFFGISLAAFGADAQLVVGAGDSVLAGEPAGIKVSGLKSGERIRLNAFRTQTGAAGPVLFRAWAEFAAGPDGVVNADTQVPLAGTYEQVDSRGLFWSGYPDQSTEPALKNLKNRTVLIRLERNGAVLASHELRLRLWNDDIVFTKVETANVSGYFAAPKGASKLPVVITLHGSEGGTFEGTKQDAGLFASHGFATLSVIYFAWPYLNTPNVTQGFNNIPVEVIANSREWLASRTEADVTRLGLRGVSKGSELALLAASDYPWVRAVAACVPTSLVWGAFGVNTGDGAVHSGFSFAGKPLANIPYGDYAPVETGKMTLAVRHRIDRKESTPEAVKAAAIPLEHSSARFLLAGGGEDDVWPSLEMVQEITARMSKAGKSAAVETLLFPKAGHYICGTGSSLSRPDKGDATPGGGNAAATAKAAGVVWEKTLAFFRSAL